MMIVKPRTEDKSTLTETLQVTELAESKSFAKDSFGSKETENEEPAEGKTWLFRHNKIINVPFTTALYLKIAEVLCSFFFFSSSFMDTTSAAVLLKQQHSFHAVFET